MQHNTDMPFNGQVIFNIFSQLEDPRVRGRCKYKLIEIIFISICAILCGAKYYQQIEDFAHARLDWFRKYIPLEHGVPSYKTICRVFLLIPPADFLACFIDWSVSIANIQQYDTISIDGKTLRKSGNQNKNQKPLHLVNAYFGREGITIGSAKTPDKSNEIKAIPPLLKTLNIAGCVITIDAMGTQKGIANLIILRGANYVLALKENHKRFFKQVESLFNQADALKFNAMVFKKHTTKDYDHSRYEEREYTILPIMYYFPAIKIWKNIQTLIRVRSIRDSVKGKEVNIRYYISSLPLEKYLLISDSIRQHWSIENGLHWKLDVSLQEDNCRIHNPNAAENFSTLRKIVLYLLGREVTTEGGICMKQWKAALNTNYLEKLIGF